MSLGAVVSASSFRQTAGAVLRTTGGRLAVTGAATLGGRLDTPAVAAGDVPLLTASTVNGTFAGVTGGYGATAVTLHPHGAPATAVPRAPQTPRRLPPTTRLLPPPARVRPPPRARRPPPPQSGLTTAASDPATC